MSRSLSRAVLLLGAITLPISGRLCAQVAKVALGTEPVLFGVRVYNDEVVPDPNPARSWPNPQQSWFADSLGKLLRRAFHYCPARSLPGTLSYRHLGARTL